MLCHGQLLPDWCADGLSDAKAIIRAKFIGIPESSSERVRFLLTLQPRDFECLVERLYKNMGYSTELTPFQKDGGRDVIATRRKTGAIEHLRIECKHYTQPVGVRYVRALLGVVSDEKVNKGVLVTTDRFTRDAQEFASQNPRLELISGTQLVPLLNEHLGSDWPLYIDRYILEATRGATKSIIPFGAGPTQRS